MCHWVWEQKSWSTPWCRFGTAFGCREMCMNLPGISIGFGFKSSLKLSWNLSIIQTLVESNWPCCTECTSCIWAGKFSLMTFRDIKSCQEIRRFLWILETTIAQIFVQTLFRVVSKVVNPHTGRVVPPAWRNIVGAKGRIFKPHWIANCWFIKDFDAPVSGRELTLWFPVGVDSHKYNGGVGDAVPEQYSIWAFWHSSLT